jgi:uncharacterized membrane protein YfcA
MIIPMTTTVALVAVLIFLAALLYSSVGHAGASGYLAVMGLCGVSAAVMKPTALALNVLVAAIATVRFYRDGCFSWPLFLPFALPAVPAAFVGGAVTLPGQVYRPVVGVVLLLAAIRLLRPASPASAGDAPERPLPLAKAAASGAVIGLLSGLTGTGGGIFLTPLLLFTGWAGPKESAGVSAAFILVNSAAGLAGRLASLADLPGAIPYWAVAAGAGGLVGADLGSRRLGNATLRRLLAVVLVVAGLKLVLVP